MSDNEYRDPADETEVVVRHATLETLATVASGEFFVSFRASNGETLGTGETHWKLQNAEDSLEAWITAMVDVLEERGYMVFPPVDEDAPLD